MLGLANKNLERGGDPQRQFVGIDLHLRNTTLYRMAADSEMPERISLSDPEPMIFFLASTMRTSPLWGLGVKTADTTLISHSG